MTPEERRALETERDFLLRSLDDLEVERAADNVDDGTYRQLHDDYTARAAAAIRSLAADTDLTPPDPPAAGAAVRVLTIGSIVVFALVAAFLLTRAIGQRRPGQTITGNGQVAAGVTSTTTLDPGLALKDDAAKRPGSYAARIAYARYLLQHQDFPDAIHEFGAAARIDPSQPEPPTYAGWAGALLAQSLQNAKTARPLFDASLERIDEVITAHSTYPDAYALKGVILFDFEKNARNAIPAFQHFLVLTDDSNAMRPQVLAALAQAEKVAGSSK